MSSLARTGAVALVASTLATANWSAADAQTQPRPDDLEPRKGESYEPVGVPLGGFRLFPQLELIEQYNTNIFATNRGKTDDLITLVQPSLDLRSNWNNHMLNFFASAGFGIYASNSSEDFKDYRVGFNGRLDIQRNWYIYGGAQFSHLHEDRTDPEATSFGKLSQYNQTTANVGYYQKFNRFSVKLDGRFDDYTYTNNRAAGFGIISNRDRDRSEYTESLRLAYEFIDGYEFWVQGGLNQRNYSRRVDSAGFRRSSTGWEVLGGATFDFGGITQLEVFGGYRDQAYDDSRFGHLRGAMFGLTGTWNPIVPLFVKPFVKRSLEETVSTSHIGYWATAFGVNVDYDMRPNIKISSSFSYTIADYKKAKGAVGAANRNDDYIVFDIGVRYLPTENFFIGPAYQFSSRNSNLAGTDFARHLFSLRLGARL